MNRFPKLKTIIQRKNKAVLEVFPGATAVDLEAMACKFV